MQTADGVERVAVAGHDLEYFWTRRPRTGETVLVFLHEGLGSARLWHDFPARIGAAAGLPALVYSRHGHGASDVLREPRAVTYMHDEALEALPALRATLGLDDVILVGHSDGASIALIHAGAGRWPVRGLVLEAPHVLVEERTIQGIEAAAHAYASSDLAERLGRHHADGAATFQGWSRIWLDSAFRAWNIEDCLPGITCPVLAIQGEDDEYGTGLQLERIERQCRGPVQTVLLPDCRHAPHRDQPDVVCRRMVEFIQRTASEGASAGRAARDTGPR